jgi:hypothetical protein
MPDWGTVLGSGYDAFFDRKDKNREFQLRKQQEDALNTLRQIQIDKALKEAELSAEIRKQLQPQPYFQGDKFSPLGQQRYGQLMGGVTQNLEGWNPTQLKELGIQQENPEFAPRNQQVRGLMQSIGGETPDLSPNELIKMILPIDLVKGVELATTLSSKNDLSFKDALRSGITPESWEEFKRTGQRSALKFKDKESATPYDTTLIIKNLTEKLKRPPTAGEILQAERDAKIAISKAGAANVSVVNKVGEKGMTELSGEMGKKLVEERKDVEGAVKALDNLEEAQSLLDAGMVTGSGAEYLVSFGNLLQSRLGFDTGKGAIANTQAYAATMGTQVGQIIKQFGSGSGLSDADREYAEKIVGGKITLNEKAIRKLLDINKRAYENVIKNFNIKADQVMSKPSAKDLPYDLRINYTPKNKTQKKEKIFRNKYNY